MKTGKKITEKTEQKKNPIKPIKFLKKPVGSVRFRFYNKKTEKTEPKPTKNRKKNQAKTEPNRKNRAKTEPNRAKPKKTEPKPEKPSQTGLNRFLP